MNPSVNKPSRTVPPAAQPTPRDVGRAAGRSVDDFATDQNRPGPRAGESGPAPQPTATSAPRDAAGPGSGSRRLRRLLVVVGTLAAALAAWVLLVPVGGIELEAEQGPTIVHVGAVSIGFAATAMALAGWALLAILERKTARATRIWTIVAVIACVLSLGSPLVSGIGLGAKLGLASLHLVVGATTILGLRRTTR